MLAEQRRPAILDAEAVHAPRQTELAALARNEMLGRDHHAARVELSVVEELVATQHGPGGHTCRLQRLGDRADLTATSPILDRGVERADVCPARGGIGIAWIGEPFRMASRAAQGVPFVRTVNAEGHPRVGLAAAIDA